MQTTVRIKLAWLLLTGGIVFLIARSLAQMQFEQTVAEGIEAGIAINVDRWLIRQDLILSGLAIVGGLLLQIPRRMGAISAFGTQLLVLGIFVRWLLWTHTAREEAGIADWPITEWREGILAGAQWSHVIFAGFAVVTTCALAVALTRPTNNASN